MLTQKEYHEKLIECRLDHTYFTDINQSLSGKTIVDKLADEFEIFFDFKEVCAVTQKYTPLANMIWFPSPNGSDLEQNKNTKC